MGGLLRNMAWLLFSQGSTRLLGFAAGTLVVRRFGPEMFGEYSYILSFVMYFGFLSDGGLGRYLIRDAAAARPGNERYPGEQVFSQVMGLRIALAVLWYVLMLVLALATGAGGGRLLGIAIAGGTLFTGAISGPFASMFFAREQMRAASLSAVTGSLANAAALAVVLALGGSVIAALTAVTLAGIAPVVVLVWMWRRQLPIPRPRMARRPWLEALRRSFPYLVLGVVGLVYFRIDAMLLTWLQGPAATGLYVAAYRLLDAVTDLPGVVVAALFPAFARGHLHNRADLRRSYQRIGALLTLGGLLAGGALFLTAGPLMRLLYGMDFAESAAVLRLLAVAVALIFADTANTLVLYSRPELRNVVWLSLVTTAANLVLNLVLIPRYSSQGAAVATIASTVLSLAIFTPVVLRYLRSEPASSSSAAP